MLIFHGQMTGTADSTKAPANFYETTRRHIPQNSTRPYEQNSYVNVTARLSHTIYPFL